MSQAPNFWLRIDEEITTMEPRFWHQRWESNDTAFHEGQANSLLVKYFDRLSLTKESRVFLPLCGKTLDIHWLLAAGFRIAGAELSEIAVKQLFDELGLRPAVSKIGFLDRYSAKNIDIYVGDIFELSRSYLGPVDAVYDRAALVALPPDMRQRYAKHLATITDQAPQLLICYEYNQDLMAGPPFSITPEEVHRHYCECYESTLLESIHVPAGLKGKCPAQETIWLLKKNKAPRENVTSL